MTDTENDTVDPAERDIRQHLEALASRLERKEEALEHATMERNAIIESRDRVIEEMNSYSRALGAVLKSRNSEKTAWPTTEAGLQHDGPNHY